VRELRVGIAGAGFIAGAHARAYQTIPGARVVAIADPVLTKAEQLAGDSGAEAYTDFAQLLDADLDLLSVCTPSPTHADLAIAGLDAGLHVLCEKPIARTLEDAQRLVEAAESSTGMLMIGHVSRFEPDHRSAKEIVAAGQLGTVRTMSHSITASLPGWSEGGWLSDYEASGGPLVDLAVHSFDFLSWVAGSDPVRVHAIGADTAAGKQTYVLTTLRYRSGAMALVETSWAHPEAHGFRLATELIGTEGRLSWDYDSISGGVVSSTSGTSVKFDPLGERGFSAELGAFVAAVRAGGPSPVPASEALNALRTALAAGESLRTGEPTDLTAQELR